MTGRADTQLQQHGIRNPIAFVQSCMTDQRRKSSLSSEQWDDMAQDLSEDLCVLAKRYDQRKSARQGFTTWAGRILRLRAESWYREQHGLGDSRYKNSKRRATLVAITDNERENLPAELVAPEILEMINSAELSPEAQDDLRLLVLPMVEGGYYRVSRVRINGVATGETSYSFNITEFARKTGHRRRWVDQRVKALGEELKVKWEAA